MTGFLYRRAVALKDAGERISRVTVFGVRIFRQPGGALIRLGLGLKEASLRGKVM